MPIAPDEALRIVLARSRPLRPRRAALAQAHGHVLAEDVRSDRDQPPADRSAMDGYAVIAADARKLPARLRILGEVAAGSAARGRVRRGTCVQILTGGNLPPGADAVVPVEQTRRDGDGVLVLVRPRRAAHVRRRGEEARRGELLLRKGTLLGPAQIGVCAMVGKAEVKVHPRPRIALVVTGAEVLDVGSRVRSHELRDSNGPALLAALVGQGFGVPKRDLSRLGSPSQTARRLAPDDPGRIAAILQQSLRTADVIVVTGGVSVGRYDFVPESIRRIGGRIRFHGVNMKPGRPQLYATLPGNRHIFALPGNPVSVLTGLYELVLPGLRRLAGLSKDDCRPAARVRLAAGVRSRGNRTSFVLARLVMTPAGPAATPVPSTGSADLIAAARADGVIVVPAGIAMLRAGAMVEFHAWD